MRTHRDRWTEAFDWIYALTILTRVLGASAILLLATQQSGY
ncbi:hypothetical protein [Actinospica robiniae]|nr:hypothetical protein [Actinospica robiniae]